MVTYIILFVAALVIVEVLKVIFINRLSWDQRRTRKRQKYDKNTRGSPFYVGQAPYLVVRENGREKAYYRKPSSKSKRYTKDETAKSC
jgi:hypothetical protein